MTSGDFSPGLGITIPYSAEDFAKGLRHTIRTLQDVQKLGGFATKLYDHHKARRAARRLPYSLPTRAREGRGAPWREPIDPHQPPMRCAACAGCRRRRFLFFLRNLGSG